jgi:hypothetical protein
MQPFARACTARSALTPPADNFWPGQAVHVNVRAAWLAATVTSISRTRIGLDYRPGTPTYGPLAPAVAPWLVRPAAGVRLQAVHGLRFDDQVIAFDGTDCRVAAVWPARDRWWVIAYTHGECTAVPAGAVLRLADPTPTVTVGGIPICSPSPS